MNRFTALVTVLTLTLLGLSSQAASLSAASSSVLEPDSRTLATYAVGLIIDSPTLVVNSPNWSANLGLQRAQADLGITSKLYTTSDAADYGPKLQQCATDGNDLCIGVGFLLADAALAAANANPGVHFATIDATHARYPANLRGVTFASDEVGFLAGTLAALMTESKVIGTIGGMTGIVQVDLFMNGYRNGARRADHTVTVLTHYVGAFDRPDLGAQAAQEMLAQGADVIFPVAGPTGDGALLTATQAGAWSIGVDTDQYLSLFNSGGVPGAGKLLSSAMKRFDNAVYATVSELVSKGVLVSGTVVFGLSMEGVGLAPFHEAEAAVPQSVKSELERVRLALIAGTIDPASPFQIRTYLPCALRF